MAGGFNFMSQDLVQWVGSGKVPLTRLGVEDLLLGNWLNWSNLEINYVHVEEFTGSSQFNKKFYWMHPAKENHQYWWFYLTHFKNDTIGATFPPY